MISCLASLTMHVAGTRVEASPLVNGRGEVCEIADVSQFHPGKTEYACGFYSAGMTCFAGMPDQGPAGSALDINAWAEREYVLKYGSADAGMAWGVSVADEHALIAKALTANPDHIHYRDLEFNVAPLRISAAEMIRKALRSGYPVVASVTETSVFDLDLGRGPYAWTPAGTHVFVITGFTAGGDLLVHDPANVVGDLQGSNWPRPSPRRYAASALEIQWAIMARLPWLTAFPPDWNPGTGAPLNQVSVTSIRVERLSESVGHRRQVAVDGRRTRLGGHFLPTAPR